VSARNGAGPAACTSAKPDIVENGKPHDIAAPPSSAKPGELLATLSELFPACFVAENWQPHRPLKCGVANDLITLGVLQRAETRALGWYVARRMYQVALAAGGARYDLDGNVAGEVTLEQAEKARAMLADMDRRQVEAASAASAARQVERAKRKSEREAEAAKAAREFIAARRAARKAVEEPKGPAPYHASKDRCTAAGPAPGAAGKARAQPGRPTGSRACPKGDGHMTSPASPFGPWSPTVHRDERVPQLRTLRAIAYMRVGPRHPLVAELRAAEHDPAAAERALALFDALPSLTRRRLRPRAYGSAS
jgi:ProP effector